MKRLIYILLLLFPTLLPAQQDSSVVICDSVLWQRTRELPDSLIKVRLNALPRVIDMTYNHVVKSFINRYLYTYPQLIVRLDNLSKHYFPLFQDILYRHGLPDELKYLPVIESALNASARSKMGAVGLWQFMPSTGTLFGLEINALIDERCDEYKSTEAACKYMLRMYDTFHDWTLVLAAYNCGPGNVLKAMRRSGGTDFWTIYPFLPSETRSYVPIFVAANYALNYYPEHGLCGGCDTLAPDEVVDTLVTVQRQHLVQISEVLGMPLNTVRRLNPQYVRDIVPGGKPYSVCLPSEKTLDYITLEDSILAYKSYELLGKRVTEIDLLQRTSIKGSYTVGGVTYYKIRSGDTLSGIAYKFHCSVKQLQKWNGLRGTTINVGKTLKILR